jgi:hypothetical protein
MTEQNPLGDRGRALEEEYFRKKDRELLEKMRAVSAAAAVHRELSEKTGLRDAHMLEELQALGFTPETAVLLPFVPLVQMAWAGDEVTDAERQLILNLASTRGIQEGSAAGRQLRDWLTTRPAPQVFSSAVRLIRAALDSPTAGAVPLTADEMVSYCEQIAAASGGIFGINRVSAEERALLDAIGRGLQRRS